MKPIGYYCSSTNLAEQKLINLIETLTGSTFEELSTDEKIRLAYLIADNLHNVTISSSLCDKVFPVIQQISVNNQVNLLAALSESLIGKVEE